MLDAVGSDAAAGARPVARRSVSPALLWGAAIVGPILVLALIAPLVVPYPYNEMHHLARLAPPSREFWLGTDEFGRDVLSRVLMGARLSLVLGFLATLVSLVLGVPLGLVAGYAGGRIDGILMRAADVLMSFPPILFGVLILAFSTPSLEKAALVVGIIYVPSIVRIIRIVTMGLAHEEFVVAARARGESPAMILFREILPNVWPCIVVEGSLRITFAILLGAALSFLGMGAQPPSSDWGLMISEARPFMLVAPWIALAPGIAMCATVIGVNLLGDALREWLDPHFYRRA
jgi:peptide/nickel transport system permease protein